MLGSLLIALREGLEAALVIGIILAYLARTDNRRGFKPVWLGVLLAVATSLIAGAAIYLSAGELKGRSEAIFEGATLIIAAGVLTWMIFWMRKQAVNIKGHLETQISSALKSGSSAGLLVLSFVAAGREGIEMVLFLFASTKVAESPILSTFGVLLGLAVAAGIGYIVYRGSSRLNLKTFFNVTSILLILFAAGLLSHGIQEFHEAGIVPYVMQHVWDMNHFIPEDSTFGRFLSAIFGYNASPSLVEVVAYFVYLISVLVGYFHSIATTKRGKILNGA